MNRNTECCHPDTQLLLKPGVGLGRIANECRTDILSGIIYSTRPTQVVALTATLIKIKWL